MEQNWWTLPSTVEQPSPLRQVAGTPFVVVHGQPMCITRGFDVLGKRAGQVVRTVKTPVETLKRPMKLVKVAIYYPVIQRYDDAGEFWADAHTGTIYNPFDGKCMSSDMLSLVLE